MRPAVLRWMSLLVVTGTVAACSVNRPVNVVPEPRSLSDYLDAHHPADVLVTDSAGHSQMVHDPRVEGDSLRGLKNRELPRQHLAISVATIRGIAVPEFSAGKTLGLTAAVLGAIGVGLLILVTAGPKPVY